MAEDTPIVLKTCDSCRPFCASWARSYLTDGGIKYNGGRHAHRIWDRYHQHYDSESEDDDEEEEAPTPKRPRVEPTWIQAGRRNKFSASVEQRIAFLCSFTRLGKTNANFALFSDAAFLEKNFKDLLYDHDKTIQFVVLYGCNKIPPEVHALPRCRAGVLVQELEEMVGSKLEVYKYEATDEETGEAVEYDTPFSWWGAGEDEAQHFVLTKEQWTAIARNETGLFTPRCKLCGLYMSVITFRNKESVDVKDILDAVHLF